MMLATGLTRSGDERSERERILIGWSAIIDCWIPDRIDNCDMSYEALAREYYSEFHVTSRNFDAAMDAFIDRERHLFRIPPSGLVLDLGAGRGRASERFKLDPGRVIEADISPAMLGLASHPVLGRVVCDGRRLPFASGSFSSVFAFLYDSFNEVPLYAELSRVSVKGAVFVGTLPHPLWGRTLRRIQGIPEHIARFQLKSGGHIDARSYLSSADQIRARMKAVGFRSVMIMESNLPEGFSEISKDVLIPANALGLEAEELSLIQIIIGEK